HTLSLFWRWAAATWRRLKCAPLMRHAASCCRWQQGWQWRRQRVSLSTATCT
ncbi:unnamed protein product, partial [Closterium sp. Yama58-4]